MHLRRIGFVLVGLLLSSCGGGSASPAGSEAAGATNTAPTISSTGNTSLSENTTQVMSVSARDADGDTLSFSLSGDDAQLLRIDADGALSFTTAPDFEAPADADEDNVYIVTVRVSDGSANAELAVTATVTNDPADDFQLAASSFSSGAAIPLIHACVEQGGNNYSPQLSWLNAPSASASFALIIDDETAPCGTDANACVHWNLFNINASITALVEDVDPATLVDATGFSTAIEGLTYAGSNDYEGPCPPAGNEHTYTLMLYALSADQPTMTRLDALTRSEFEEAYAGNILGQAGITGRFSN
ncbi:MAG: YbhB/YbcL family Raf kinase inhibitor-like protein [Proteobacteria bacterium]|nr:YbhB/YbcL family Raf kinase inhibitor-like protein [Pseudomonadota bacterium]